MSSTPGRLWIVATPIGNLGDLSPRASATLRDADGYFMAQAVQMRDKDVILISNAETTQLQKALAVVRGFTGIAYDLTRQVR